MALVQVTPPAALLDASDAVLRQHLRLESDENDEDVLISALVKSATAKVESFLRRRLIDQRWALILDRFPCRSIRIPVAPVVSIHEVSWRDEDGVWTVLDPNSYQLVDSVHPKEVTPVAGNDWPTVPFDRANVRIEFDTGYGANASSVPEDILHAVRLLVAHWFMNREAVTAGGSFRELPIGIQDMLFPHVVWV